ncbi:MAG TPA: phosphatase PAP2 family protein [Acidimicrobiales bacterium]
MGAFDAWVDRWFAEHLRGRPVADRIFYGASALGDHGVIWLILAAIRGLRSDEGVPAAVRAAAGIGIESALVNGPVKWVFRRERPVVLVDRPLPLRRPLTSSFPSGHATSAFCAAALLSDGDTRWAPVYYGLAVVVAWSRVHVSIHHASDVVAGMVIGSVIGEASTRVVQLPQPAPPSGGI